MPQPPKHRCYPIFSDEDADLRSVTWYANRGGYARGQIAFAERAYAHLIVIERKIGRKLGDGEYCDHQFGNQLDDRRDKLRVVSPQQNQHNAGLSKNNRSGFKGVSWLGKNNCWRAYIRYGGKTRHLGCFQILEDAARAYDTAAIREFGDFASLNFPLGEMRVCHRNRTALTY